MAAPSSNSRALQNFCASHPVFTHAEALEAHAAGGRSHHTSNNLLARHVASGRLLRVRRGLYAPVPPGTDPRTFSPDPYLVAGRLRDDAVVAYHGALAFHGRAHSLRHQVQYLTAARARPFTFRGFEFVAVQAPLAVRALPDFGGGVLVRPHAGGRCRVASLERCLVDVLHAPEHGGGWEEIWRSFDMVGFLDLGKVVELTLRMQSALTVGRVGFFLEQHRQAWMVEDTHLQALQQHAPAQPRYLDPRRESGALVRRWNLIVAQFVLERRWEEPLAMAPRKPLVVLLAGPNGAGKSTSAERFLRGALTVDEFVNADTIAQGLSAFRSDAASVAAGRVMLERTKFLAKERRDFSLETTLAGRGHARWLRELRLSGYRAHLIFLALRSADLAVARVAERVRQRGHNVPEPIVRRRFAAGLRNLFSCYADAVGSWEIYDNSSLIGPRLIAAKAPGKSPAISDEDAWNRLQELTR